MMMVLLLNLVEAWSTLYTKEEIWHDEAKLKLLLNAREELGDETLVPSTVLDYYETIFMRQMWD